VKGHTDNGGSAARFFYCAKASKRDRDEGLKGFEEKPTVSNMCSGSVQQSGEGERLDGNPLPKRANNHPTVKPTDLMRYLCRLVTPPGGTVLDPFMGSGSTGKAAMLEGFDFIGIERDPEYVKIAEARIGAARRLL
jgi:site-specific DNA-methyltransferase (adenine-specific)